MKPFMSFLLGGRIIYARIIVFYSIITNPLSYDVKYEIMDNVDLSPKDILKLSVRLNYIRDKILAGLRRGNFTVNNKFIRLLNFHFDKE